MAHKDSEDKIDTFALEACHKAARLASGQNPTLNFVNQILTRDEQIKIGRRLLVAQAILNGKTRMEICDTLQISPNTYRQVNLWLNSEFRHYKPKRKKLSKAKHQSKKYTKPFTYEDLKRRYPMHFLLFSLAENLFKNRNK